MEFIGEFFLGFLGQLQTFPLAFMIFGVVASAFKSQLEIPQSIYKFCVFMLLMRVGLTSGLEIREVGFDGLVNILVPAIICVIIGIGIVLIGSFTLAKLPGVRHADAMGTAGLFGAVSASTFIAGGLYLEQANIPYESWIAALYPFMDIPALISAIVLANLHVARKNSDEASKIKVWPIVKECLRGHSLTALIGGLLLGIFTIPEVVYDGFYNLLFQGFLSVLMVHLGIEAYRSIKEFLALAHWYLLYAILAPFVHGLLGFGLGFVAHLLVGLSPGGVIMIAIIASSSSDISGPPTIGAGIPQANPSTYIGTSTGVGTPIAIGICIPFFVTLGQLVFN